MTDIYRNMTDHIAEHGHSLMAVGAGDDSPPFYYTIGLALADLPELLVIGFNGPGGLLYDLARVQIDTGKAFADGDEYRGDGWAFGVRFVAVPDSFRDEYTIQTGQYLEREDYALLQVVLPDARGRWPHEKGCHRDYRAQLAWQPKLH